MNKQIYRKLENIKRYAIGMHRRPIPFLLHKAKDTILKKLRRPFEGTPLSPYSAKSNLRVYLRKGIDLTKILEEKASMRFFFEVEDVRHLTTSKEERLRTEQSKIVARGEQIINNTFDLLGSGPTYLGNEIDWSSDFKSGRSWLYRHYASYSYIELLDLNCPSDIKIPWELSRLQFLVVLSLAYLYTRKDIYAEKLIQLLDSWDRKNPVGWGVSWVCTMEVSLRAISLIWVIELMHGTKWERKILNMRMLRILIEHGKFIYRNIEYSDINGNHHTACILGLLYLGLFLKKVPEARRWIKCAVEGVQREILLQTYPDGVSHEGSIPYHRLVTEMFLHAGLLCRRNQIDLGIEFWGHLEKMLEFVMAYTKPNGLAPLFGDADDGRVISLGGQDINDHRYLLTIGATVFQRTDMKVASGGLWEDAMWLLGREGIEKFKYQPKPEINLLARSWAFPEGGFFFLKNGHDDYVAIDCGDVGLRGRGGHGHNDALSFEVCLHGQDIITDSGCFTYSGSRELRRHSISAVAHNVAIIDGQEPSPLDERWFAHPTKCPTCIRLWEVGNNLRLFEGEHYGYHRLSSPITYRRRIQLNHTQSYIQIIDSLTGKGQHHVIWNFHLAVGLEAVVLERGNKVLIRSGGIPISVFRCLIPLVRTKIEPSEYYSSYGVCQKRLCIVLEGNMQLPVEVAFEILRIDNV